MSLAPILWATTAIALIFLGNTFQKPRNIPPGPPRSILGDNRKDIPREHPWRTFTAWRKTYGDIICFYLGQTPAIVLNSVKIASDLLEKRGSIYSSRPRNIIGNEILSGGMRGIGMPYGQRWRNWRSLMHAGISIEASNTYRELQDIESRILLKDLLGCGNTSTYSLCVRRFIISIVFCVSYGRRIGSIEDEIIKTNEKIDHYIISSQVPGKFMVESWSILLYLPRSLQWFRWDPERQKSEDTKFYLRLMNSVKAKMISGTAHACTATRALDKQADFGMSDVEAAYALSAPSQAGVGTTFSVFEVFLLAMLHYPEKMKKAQQEIDSVFDSGRMPGFDSEKSLPYLHALINETLRWQPIIPTGLAHSVIEDDIYEGMFIPKGSTIYANIHAMTRDEEIFPEPEKFRPERFLDTTDPKLINYTISFGFGRRICPGMHIAYQSLFILISRLLWAFDILPVTDALGNPILPSVEEFTTGLVIRPKPFEYRLALRRREKLDIIMEEAGKAEEEAAGWE